MRAPVILAALLLGGCATLSDEECLTADWRAVGQGDGARGRDGGFVTQHARACAEVGVAPDVAAWEAGRREGLAGYCTPLNAYRLAASGGGLAPVCAGFDQAALAAADAEGREEWLRRERLRAVERAIDRREREIARLRRAPKPDARTEARIRALRHDIRRLELDAALGGIGRRHGGFLFRY